MNMSRRYTIFNLYIRGSNQAPQACHALDALIELRDDGEMSQEAKDLYLSWRKESKVEIMLQGGYHQALEDLYSALQGIPSLPSAKFNESMEALNGACTVVTFVASDRIVKAAHFARNNRFTPANIVASLGSADVAEIGIESKLTDDELFVIQQITFLPLSA